MKTSEILEQLDQMFPDAHCELNHRNAYELAVAVVLSAQTTDASVNRVSPALFERFPDAASMAAAKVSEIEPYIRSLGLYHNKAVSIHGLAEGITERFDGKVPDNMKDLMTLPGVGRKCANVILAECYGVPSIAVDTHVSRISRRLGFADPEDDLLTVEKHLRRKIPKARWIRTHHQMIFFGRRICHARNPECSRCPFVKGCREPNKHFSGNSEKD
ncbi:endonuclease III [Erysipelotrichaceae bacterium Oil+RF-744-GAM-WT-6]|uniref:Endonuclease III n=1 Tax=Stecheria intestinalis TaxID=2606630 RepID=A0A7X2NTG7_9FIRM|nr:endonuclease III [Stecheria intestinalis]MSS58951.1 endonuclease III [Stecheria intestinalis]